MNIWDPFISSVAAHVPDAAKKIVFDKLHVAQRLGEAVDQVRRKRTRTLKAAGGGRLAGTRYNWLRDRAAIEPQNLREFDVLRRSGLKTACAWVLQATAMALYGYIYERLARKHFRSWQNWALRSRLQPMTEVARTLRRRLEIIITYLRHRVVRVASELINARIQWVKYTVRGFRNKQNFIHAIYFYCGGLDLAPLPTKIAGSALFLNDFDRLLCGPAIVRLPALPEGASVHEEFISRSRNIIYEIRNLPPSTMRVTAVTGVLHGSFLVGTSACRKTRPNHS